MAVIKACPRCKGTLMMDRDHHGWYEHCLQCGYQRDLEGAAPPVRPIVGGAAVKSGKTGASR